jgi:tRNA A37 methylthiotransferase MiaB
VIEDRFMKHGKPVQSLLFLQLPRLENDSGAGENLPMASLYLFHAVERAGLSSRVQTRWLTPQEEELDDRHLLEQIVHWRPDLICCTLYLWNIERTLQLMRRVRKALSSVKVIVGGPEVAFQHPFLFKTGLPDVAVVGEGEGVFPQILSALEKGVQTDFDHVAWKTGRRYSWGQFPDPDVTLQECLPPAHHSSWNPDANGMAYLETGRGCPLRCSYCRYGHLRRKMTFLDEAEVSRRVSTLMDRGAKEIRFVDPVFNTNPDFQNILHSLCKLNRKGRLRFFAEVQADLLNPDQIRGLAEAGFSELEAGVQSLDPRVLKRVRRPVRLVPLESNLHLMAHEGIRVTIDLMYGLPGQTLQEVRHSLKWAGQFERANVQCLQTLLLPGTELRTERRQWRMQADDRPPYGVRSTSTLSDEDVRALEEFMHRKSPLDCMTEKFVGTILPDLFKERITLDLTKDEWGDQIPGVTSRRALIFKAPSLFAHRKELTTMVRKAISSEPNMLWQFVLQPEREEPLDLLDVMIAEIRKEPLLWTDRFASVAGWDRIASRRIFVLLKPSARYSKSWVKAVEALLEDHFY